MKFFRENKLLISLFIAIFLVLIVVAVFTSARYVPGMSKYTDRAYYDLPKGQLPAETMTPQAKIEQQSKMGFIDPIYKERLRADRGGIPLPSDILPGQNTVPTSADKKLANIGLPVIPGFGKAPIDSYDELYNPKSPYKLMGRPGRLGEKMRKQILEYDEHVNDPNYGVAEIPKPDPSIVPAGSVKTREIDIDRFRNTLMGIFRVIQAVKDASQDLDTKPIEGKLEKDKNKKEKEKSTKK